MRNRYYRLGRHKEGRAYGNKLRNGIKSYRKFWQGTRIKRKWKNR